IHLKDARDPAGELDEAIKRRLPARTPVLEVHNKVDLVPNGATTKPGIYEEAVRQAAVQGGMPKRDDESAAGESPTSRLQAVEHTGADSYGQLRNEPSVSVLAISAKTGIGLDALRRKLLDIAGWNPGAESPWLARERHLVALRNAAEHLDAADEHASHADNVLDLFAEELRLAHEELCAITGQFTSDDLLGEIFSSFCIGK